MAISFCYTCFQQGGHIYGCTADGAHQQASQQQNVSNALGNYGMLSGYAYPSSRTSLGRPIASSPMPVAQASAPTVTKRRCIERLREEIKDWHGSILK